MENKPEERTLSRRQFLEYLGYAAGGTAVLASLPVGENVIRRLRSGGRWYEVVQDMQDPHNWHINLYDGPELGDLSRGNLLEHRVAPGAALAAVKKGLEHPARIQHLSGYQEWSV